MIRSYWLRLSTESLRPMSTFAVKLVSIHSKKAVTQSTQQSVSTTYGPLFSEKLQYSTCMIDTIVSQQPPRASALLICLPQGLVVEVSWVGLIRDTVTNFF